MVVRSRNHGYSPNCITQITFIFVNNASLLGSKEAGALKHGIQNPETDSVKEGSKQSI